MPAKPRPKLTPERYRKQVESLSAITPKVPRRRCHNCDGLFDLTKFNKRFCSEKCRKEYFRYGSAFGPLKNKLTKEIRLTVAAESKERKQQLAELHRRITALEDAVSAAELDRAARRVKLLEDAGYEPSSGRGDSNSA